MKRFAAHYLFLPNCSFLKQYGIEISMEGTVTEVFPLLEEIEAIEWFPGVIALLPEIEIDLPEIYTSIFKINTWNINNLCDDFKNQHIDYRHTPLYPYLFYPFDFTSMPPVAETRHRQLR